MAWNEITEADVLTVLSGPELEAIRAAALGSGQVDPVTPTITQVTDLVRGYVDASGKYILGATGIPQKLLAPALDIIAFRIPNRVGQDPGSTRKDLHDKAITLLEQVAAGKFGIEEPLVESTEATPSPTPGFTAKTLTFTKDDQDGL